VPSTAILALLILVDRLCYDRHKIDYTQETMVNFPYRVAEAKIRLILYR
jgi:hypothetical protein